FNEFLPSLLGPNAIARYQGYDPDVNPGIANEFATAAYRFGHSMLGTDIEFMNNEGNTTHEELELRESFFAPGVLPETGIDGIMKYLASDRAQEIDTLMVDDLRNFLFGPPGSSGMDLASLNIQRGRDHGLASYNDTRAAYGLERATDFSDITSDIELQQSLADVYKSVDQVELWVGGLAEDHLRGTSMGELFTVIIADQFTRLRDGDRFYFENVYTGADLTELRHTRLADVIRNNTSIDNLQRNVFRFRAEVSGRVTRVDGPQANRVLGQSRGVADVTVNLLDESGDIVASAQSDRLGRYRFSELDLGQYRVELELAANQQLIGPRFHEMAITRGMGVNRMDFAIRLVNPARPTNPIPPSGPVPRQAPPVNVAPVAPTPPPPRVVAATPAPLPNQGVAQSNDTVAAMRVVAGALPPGNELKDQAIPQNEESAHRSSQAATRCDDRVTSSPREGQLAQGPQAPDRRGVRRSDPMLSGSAHPTNDIASAHGDVDEEMPLGPLQVDAVFASLGRQSI
ncbi:MAG: hypothetical protein KDB23_19600, partial [Planctomycetales bacterium]|nr:hypothetical protein [Planctomycetales bacterium]